MTEKISAEQRYVTAIMRRLPNAEKGKVHTVKDGDCLWNIAKRELNKKNAKNSEICDYVFLIAKLNNLDTIEKMNSLKVSDKIYLPKSQKVQTSASNNTAEAPKVRNNALKKPAEISKEFTDAEISILNLKKILLDDKTVNIEKMYKGYPSDNDIYTVYNSSKYSDSFVTTKHPIISFTQDRKSGKIKSLSFDNQIKDKYFGKFDYDMDDKGNIFVRNNMKNIKAGNIDNKELNEIHSILQKKIKGEVKISF